MCDDDLPAALADDLDGAFERLVESYQRRLYAFALRWSGRREDAEEIAQDALVRAYRALSGYPAERVRALALRPWLFRIALNVARNRARAQSPPLARLEGADGAILVDPPDDEREQPESRVLRAEREHMLADLLASLPERYRAAVFLRHVEGLGYAEIAGALGQPVGTVKANVHRGVRELRAALTEQAAELTQVR